MFSDNIEDSPRHQERSDRFRILIVGRANAGKTTILRRICDSTENPEIYDCDGNKVSIRKILLHCGACQRCDQIDPSQVEGTMGRGIHNIENELIFRSNDKFVFHDSQGFKAGSEAEFVRVKEFIADRAKTAHLKKRIHAIWYCIPMDKLDRAVRRFEEMFFDECDPGNVPVLVLFTKFDTLLPVALGKLSVSDRQLPLQERVSKAKGLIDGIFQRANLWGQLTRLKYTPKCYVRIGDMHKSSGGFHKLLEATSIFLDKETLQRVLISAQEELPIIRKDFADLQQRCDALSKERNNVQEANQSLGEELTTIQKDFADLQQRCDALSEERDDVQKANQSLGKELTTVRKDFADLQQHCNALSKEHDDVRKELMTVRRDIAELQQRYEIRSTELQKRCDVLSKQRDEVWAEFQANQSRCEELKQHNEIQSTELDSLRKQLRDKLSPSQRIEQEKFDVRYGVVCSLPVNRDDEEHVRRKDKWEVDPTGALYVPGYFETKVRMGPDSHEDKQFRDAFSLIESNPANFSAQEVSILCYRGNSPNPKWVDEDESSFSVLCNIDIDLSEAVKDLVMKNDSGYVYYRLDYDVIVSFGRTDVHAEVCWISATGERRNSAKVTWN